METYRHIIDYYIKDLHPDEQRGICGDLKEKFTSYHKKYINDIKNDYKNVLENCAFDNKEDIKEFLQEVVNLFIAINERMIKNGRFPLFKDPYNLLESMEWRDKLLEYLPESECNKIVGCKSYKEHYPLVYKQMTQGSEETKGKNLEH